MGGSPVTHAQVGVVHRLHHQSATLSVAACEAVMSVSVVVLLHNQQHDWRLLRHQLAQATNGQTLPLSFFLDANNEGLQIQGHKWAQDGEK